MDRLFEHLLRHAEEARQATVPFLAISEEIGNVQEITNDLRIKAPIRFLLACCLAKLDNPSYDIRKPYTEIGGQDTFSGRKYDERYIQKLIEQYDLPCNTTTAFLTPAFRNRNTVMRPDTRLLGRNPALYTKTLTLLSAVHEKRITPESLLKEILRQLFIIRERNKGRIRQLMENLRQTNSTSSLSSEQIVNLLKQHLASRNASRLPVLMVSAAYQTLATKISENVLSLHAHNAADSQTGAIGDVEVVIPGKPSPVTCYEMKDKTVTISDLQAAVKKVAKADVILDNYIFITTAKIEKEAQNYAENLFEETGIEFVILDCMAFIRHFLHFFHRHRTAFLEYYQQLVLAEPHSSVSQPLKEAFLALRQASESD